MKLLCSSVTAPLVMSALAVGNDGATIGGCSSISLMGSESNDSVLIIVLLVEINVLNRCWKDLSVKTACQAPVASLPGRRSIAQLSLIVICFVGSTNKNRLS